MFNCLQVYNLEQEKRGLCPYDDKRYLLADILDNRPNPNTHAYGHRDLVSEVNLIAVHPELGAELVIRHVYKRYDRRHVRVIKQPGSSVNIEEKMLDANVVLCELHGELLTEATRHKGAMRIEEVIERICGRQSLEPPVSPPARMPEPLSLQRAGPSGLNVNVAPFQRRIDSSDEEDDAPEQPVWPLSRRIRLNKSYLDKSEGTELMLAFRRKAPRRVQFNPFIDAETSVDGDASADKTEDDNKNDNLNGFIIADKVEF